MFGLTFDSPKNVQGCSSRCISVCPISIEVTNSKSERVPAQLLKCAPLKICIADTTTSGCVFTWCLNHSEYYVAVLDLGQWYAEEQPRRASISQLKLQPTAYLANYVVEPGTVRLLDATVLPKSAKKTIWPLNERDTSRVGAITFSLFLQRVYRQKLTLMPFSALMLLTATDKFEINFLSDQFCALEEIKKSGVEVLRNPRDAFRRCLRAGLLPAGAFDDDVQCSEVCTNLFAIFC